MLSSSSPFIFHQLITLQPGHNGFYLSPSGDQIWMVYHASSTSPGTCDGARYTMTQQ